MSETALIAADAPRLIALNLLHESPFNRRRTWGNLGELADSFKQVGILEDLLARPHPKKPGAFELVFGHRRYRAAKLAELSAAPCKVRDLTDEQVVEAQCIENLQREDVHPLDEAEGYEQLLKIGKYSHDELAAKVGKSRSYIFGRLKLLSLCEPARKAFSENKIGVSVALYLARIPSPKLQQDALNDVLPQWRDGESLSAREAFHVIEGRYMLRLADAPFDRADATLVPEAGACGACPKRTGNQPELFADVSSADVCTDPNCFATKKNAHAKRLLKEAKKKGAVVLEGKQAEEAMRYGSKLVKLDERCYEDSKQRTYRQILKGTDYQVTVAKDSRGDVHELAPRTAVAKALPPRKKSVAGARIAEDARKFREKAEFNEAKERAITKAVVAAAEKAIPTGFWPFLAKLLIGNSALDEIAARRGIEVPKEKRRGYDMRATDKAVIAAIAEMSDAQVRGLVVELAIESSYGEKALEDAAEFFKVDAKKIGDAAIAEAKAAKKGATKPTSKKGARRA